LIPPPLEALGLSVLLGESGNQSSQRSRESVHGLEHRAASLDPLLYALETLGICELLLK